MHLLRRLPRQMPGGHLIMSVIVYILIVIAAEAVTEIIGEAEIFASLRSGLKRLPWIFGGYLGGLFGCRYCLSVWAGFAGALAFPWRLIPGEGLEWVFADFAVKAFSMHRLANVLHETVNRFLDKQPFLISLLPQGEAPVVEQPENETSDWEQPDNKEQPK